MLVAAELATATNLAAKWNMRLSKIKASKMNKNHLISTCTAAESVRRATLAAKIISELCEPRLWLSYDITNGVVCSFSKTGMVVFLLLNY